ncbi:thiamine transport system substrate-binding protein [Amycolatopsis bartoniae]|uniref:Thiamine ABC transporter substrate-binding protein n=1 Tax=Amycolatopsis bartoniae TaxID=941986 RepID=A0A8H9IQB9_9PSEU|nr:thiamine ABC transporter substrate-binding protein [Amycolatopsis bartoniae]MBB2934606.1 thiamine transport system substrate-binding protein [Amycolatopsis bartoniae]TVT06929.1 thiamine ABC transporter substrate-binding protein [Amycolatopsis bartoniae]GHF46139.1 thiamine ABC transporter substrate-binding protein [Amycolatopsis bartoniae]
MRGKWSAAVVLGLTAALTTGCTLVGGSNEDSGGTVTLVTHDSWAAPQQVLDAFQQQTGIKIAVIKKGDAGALTNSLVLTKANPIGDVAYGVDSTFASRALSEGVFESYTSPEADRGPQRYAVDSEHRLSAVDLGDVCLNVDTNWFTQKGIPAPTSYGDLTDPRYKDLLVVENPATSSPGLAFLLGTIAKYGEQGWQAYWQKLKDNGLKSDSGWEEAYSQDFSGSSGKGPRPIVVSYASSPAAEIGDDGKPRTKALLDTCYRQVEYTGVLAGTKQADKAHKVVDFLLSQQFQTTVAENMYVYPARQGVALPAGWAEAAPQPQDSASLPADQVQAGRERWIGEWRSLLGQ